MFPAPLTPNPGAGVVVPLCVGLPLGEPVKHHWRIRAAYEESSGDVGVGPGKLVGRAVLVGVDAPELPELLPF